MAQLIAEPPRCLRVEEAARLLNVGRSTAHEVGKGLTIPHAQRLLEPVKPPR